MRGEGGLINLVKCTTGRKGGEEEDDGPWECLSNN